jgi:REP element-mobilizing transposase RayT
VFPAKYRRKVFSESVENTLRDVCVGISERYEIRFIEIGVDEDHVHFLVQSVPSISITQLVKTIKSITARQLFRIHPEIKQMLWGGNLWTSGYYVNTVGQYASRDVIEKYVAGQG